MKNMLDQGSVQEFKTPTHIMVLLDWPSIPESEPLEAQSAELDPTWLLQAIEPEARGGRPRKHQGTSRGFAENE